VYKNRKQTAMHNREKKHKNTKTQDTQNRKQTFKTRKNMKKDIQKQKSINWEINNRSK
jgi:hypothetical protein